MRNVERKKRKALRRGQNSKQMQRAKGREQTENRVWRGRKARKKRVRVRGEFSSFCSRGKPPQSRPQANGVTHPEFCLNPVQITKPNEMPKWNELSSRGRSLWAHKVQLQAGCVVGTEGGMWQAGRQFPNPEAQSWMEWCMCRWQAYKKVCRQENCRQASGRQRFYGVCVQWRREIREERESRKRREECRGQSCPPGSMARHRCLSRNRRQLTLFSSHKVLSCRDLGSFQKLKLVESGIITPPRTEEWNLGGKKEETKRGKTVSMLCSVESVFVSAGRKAYIHCLRCPQSVYKRNRREHEKNVKSKPNNGLLRRKAKSFLVMEMECPQNVFHVHNVFFHVPFVKFKLVNI